MLVVAVLSWTAFVLILIELNFKWTYGTHHMWHSILGMIVLVCAFFAVSERAFHGSSRGDVILLLAPHQYYATNSVHETVLLLVLDQLASDFLGALSGDSRHISGHG